MSNLYQEELLDYYRNPRNRGTLESPSFTSSEVNTSCGDQVTVMGIITDGVVEKLLFTGSGCIISQASASMLMEYAEGKTAEEIEKIDVTLIQNLIQIPLGPVRLRCGLLALHALHNGLRSIE